MAVCLTPIYGGGGLVFLVLCGPALAWAAWRRGTRFFSGSGTSTTAAWIFAGAVVLYLGYFWIIGYWVADLGLSKHRSLLSNTPLLVAAGLGLCLPQQTSLDPARIGRWTMWATLGTTGIALALFGLAHSPLQLSWVQQLNIGFGGRLEMFSRNPVIFSICLVLVAFLSTLGLDQRSRTDRFLVFVALGLTCLTVVAVTRSRGPFLAFVAIAIVMLIRSRPSLKTLTLYGAVVGLAGIGFILISPSLTQSISSFFSYLQNTVLELNAPIQNGSSSNNERRLMYEAAIEAWQAAPWTGYGYEARFSAIVPYLDRQNLVSSHHNHAHQMILNHLVAGGVGGVVVLTVLLAAPFAMLMVSHGQDFNKHNATAFAIIVILGTAGSGMTTSAFGHFVHATSLAGLLLLFLAMLRAYPVGLASVSTHTRLT